MGNGSCRCSPSAHIISEQLLPPCDPRLLSKWVEAIPMPDQTAVRITNELVKLFSTFGLPQIVHSDQGKNLKIQFSNKL